MFPSPFCHHPVTLATGITVSDQMAHMESQCLNTFANGFCFSSSAMSCAYPASGTSQFSTLSSLSSLPAILLPGVLWCLCFTTTTCLVLWSLSAAPSAWTLVTEATSMPPLGVTQPFHLPASGAVPSAAKLAQLHRLQQLSTSLVTQPRTSPRSLITHLLINASCDHWSDPQLG